MLVTNQRQEQQILKLLAVEFLEYRLGIDATEENVCCLVRHLIQFENEIEIYSSKENLKAKNTTRNSKTKNLNSNISNEGNRLILLVTKKM